MIKTRRTSVFKIFLVIITLAWVRNAQAQVIPNVPENGYTVRDFVPEKWNIIRQDSGYLNNDSLKDVAFIIEYKALKPVSAGQQDKVNPRMLVIVFGQKGNFHYVYSASNPYIVMAGNQNSRNADPLTTFGIHKDTLLLGFAGGNERAWKVEYHFIYRKSKWILAKASETVKTSGIEGQVQTWQFDFMKKKASGISYSVSDPQKTRTSQTAHLRKKQVLANMKEPFTWEILPGVLL